jgi:SPP1 gp7 family putative phage head morphogenesis protein
MKLNVSEVSSLRVVRTEFNHIANQASLESYKANGIKRYRFLASIDHRTSEICQDHNGREYDVDSAEVGVNFPPMHPNCRSTTVPIIDVDDDDMWDFSDINSDGDEVDDSGNVIEDHAETKSDSSVKVIKDPSTVRKNLEENTEFILKSLNANDLSSIKLIYDFVHNQLDDFIDGLDKSKMTPIEIEKAINIQAKYLAKEALSRRYLAVVKSRFANGRILDPGNLDAERERYSELIDDYLAGDAEVTRESFWRYLSDSGLSRDTVDSLMTVYTSEVASKIPPPAIYAVDKFAAGSEFYKDGVIFLSKNNQSGYLVERHEMGHYLDDILLRGASKNITMHAKDRLTDAIRLDVASIKKQGFRIGDSNYHASKRGDTGGESVDIKDIDYALIRIYRDVVKLMPEDDVDKERAITGYISNSLQSSLGFKYGIGHNEKYVDKYKGTYVELVANLIAVRDSDAEKILKELFPNAFQEINNILSGG